MTFIHGVLDYFAGQGALANLITIVTPVVLVILWLKRDVVRKLVDPSNVSVSAWILRHIGDAARSLNDRAITLARIAIVDDQPQDFPVDYLRSQGYQTTIYTEFALANIDALAQVDLLALDIADVVPEDPKRGGLQLIKKTKQLPNAPIVIAVSGKRFDPTVTEFFQLADAQLKKPLGNIEFESTIRGLLNSSQSPFALAHRIDAHIDDSQMNSRTKRAITRRVIRAIRGSIPASAVTNEITGLPISVLDDLVQRLKRTTTFYEVT